ncbi:sister chromatid cohesion 1 protein 3-like isoform X2 [Canna indica]|uniref:Sister chromatid cohesion 1 protein 3-like isoform X2 n=1 Tax=Canna indica TaxID=4628 RepID=A0AAQ3Q7X1_9LILI|nr:sister chromatid cohesion 1 protein 3-like isoform X2 [Canna indica]
MFYSHSLLSRKGPLGTIWVAAHCFKKLKREQIDHTDISSSVGTNRRLFLALRVVFNPLFCNYCVMLKLRSHTNVKPLLLPDTFPDKIMPEIQISYRILAQLLLGIVRIFSKKVDYLYRDCNEALSCMRTSYANLQRTVKKAALTRRRNRSLEEKGDKKENHKGLSKDSFFAESLEIMCDPYHHVTISIPERLELDSFDLDVPDDDDAANNDPYEQSRPEDHLLNDHDKHFRDECIHGEPTRFHETNSHCFTPVNDVLPPYLMDTDLEFHEEYNLSSREIKEDNLEGDIRRDRQVQVKKSLAPIMTNDETEEQILAAQTMKIIDAGTMENVENLEMSAEPFVAHETLSNQENVPASTNEDAIATQSAKTHQKDSLPIMTIGESEEQIQPVEMMETIESDIVENVKNLDKLVEPLVSHETLSSDHIDVPACTSEDAIATHLTKTHQEDSLPCELGVSSPKLTVRTPSKKENRLRTPSKKENRPMLKKRKNLFDETIVLSNETLRNGIHDASSLVCKRRKAPHTFLDAWKWNRISNLKHNIMAPLIPCMALEVKVPFESSSFFSPPLNVPIDQHFKVAGEEKQMCTKSSEVSHSHECNETAIEVLPAEDTEVPITDHFSEMEINFSSHVSSDTGLNFMDQELASVEKYTYGQDNQWSSRTRFVAQYLYDKLSHRKGEEQKASLSLHQLMQGSKRSDCARFFYEILILKEHQCVDVDQDSPYSEIIISPTPKLVAEFKS